MNVPRQIHQQSVHLIPEGVRARTVRDGGDGLQRQVLHSETELRHGRREVRHDVQPPFDPEADVVVEVSRYAER